MTNAPLPSDKLADYSNRARARQADRNHNRTSTNWSTFAVATGSAMALATTASAGIIHSGPINITSTAPALSAGADDDQFTIGGANFHLYARHIIGQTAPNRHHQSGTVGFGAVGLGAGIFFDQYGLLQAFAPGVAVGGQVRQNAGAYVRGTFVHPFSYGGFYGGHWPANVTAMAGFRIDRTQPGVTAYNQGWIRLSVDFSQAGFPNAIHALEWAYDDTGASILAGDNGLNETPEPGTAALAALALGSAAVTALRRRRNTTTTPGTAS